MGRALQFFALALIGIVVFGSNFGVFRAWIKSESNDLSPVSVQVESNETSSKRLARPASNLARVDLPSVDRRGIASKEVDDGAKDAVSHSREAQRSNFGSNGRLASKRKDFDQNAVMFEDYEDSKFDNQTDSYLSSHTNDNSDETYAQRPSSVNPIPALKDLISCNRTHCNVTGDISFLLDFAIIAHPKTATTFLGDYLNRSDETYIHSEEHCFMKPEKVQDFVRTHLPKYKRWKEEGKDIKIGIKCPGRQCVKSSLTTST